jgi:hypothetical protein
MVRRESAGVMSDALPSTQYTPSDLKAARMRSAWSDVHVYERERVSLLYLLGKPSSLARWVQRVEHVGRDLRGHERRVGVALGGRAVPRRASSPGARDRARDPLLEGVAPAPSVTEQVGRRLVRHSRVRAPRAQLLLLAAKLLLLVALQLGEVALGLEQCMPNVPVAG